MALFTDGPIASIEDLRGYDSQLLEVATVERIDVTKKLALAHDELTMQVTSLLRKVTPTWGGIVPATARVILTPALQQWHAFSTLEMVYRDAYHSQLNDRYAARRSEYRELAAMARERLFQDGLGMVSDPIPQAQAPSVLPTSGSLPDGTYYVGMSWTNAAGEEGACSNPSPITIAGSAIEVRHDKPPSNATGWHVYLGSGPQQMVRQNDAVLVLGSAWTVAGLVSDGRPAGAGQGPGYVHEIVRLIERG